MTLKPLFLQLAVWPAMLFAAQPAWQDPAVNAVNRAPMHAHYFAYASADEDRTFTFTLSPVEHAYSKALE